MEPSLALVSVWGPIHSSCLATTSHLSPALIRYRRLGSKDSYRPHRRVVNRRLNAGIFGLAHQSSKNYYLVPPSCYFRLVSFWVFFFFFNLTETTVFFFFVMIDVGGAGSTPCAAQGPVESRAALPAAENGTAVAAVRHPAADQEAGQFPVRVLLLHHHLFGFLHFWNRYCCLLWWLKLILFLFRFGDFSSAGIHQILHFYYYFFFSYFSRFNYELLSPGSFQC